MELELGRIKVVKVAFGDKTAVNGDTLTINKEELVNLLKEDPNVKNVEIDLALPGEEVRIIPVKDVIEPRVKVDGEGEVFPGFIGPVNTVGRGKTHVLDGVCVVTTGRIVGFQEGIIDMTGPGADYTPFSRTLNVVVSVEPVETVSRHEHEYVLRMAGLKAAAYLGQAAKNVKVNSYEKYCTKITDPSLPRVGYVYALQSQGLLHDTYVYGLDAKKILPTFMHPNEVMDGAIVSGNCVSACDKNTTYHHQNNPVIKALYARHGKDLNFAGVIITNENVTLADKVRASDYTAKLCEELQLDGVVISEEGFGNPDTDLMMNCRKITQRGIKTVLITDEYAGRDGSSQSLADTVPEADAVVTAGNANEVIDLPPMKKVISNLGAAEVIAGGFAGNVAPGGAVKIEIQAIIGATNELGFNRLGAESY